jgi:type IX secretion system PorP/SprF family membrane protein
MKNLKLQPLFFLFLMLTYVKLTAQSDPKLSAYFFTPLTYNPAYAGSYEGMSFSSAYSSQWVGFDGAPKTFFLSAHGTFFNSNTGLGLDVINDNIGATTETKTMLNFAYHIELNDQWHLSLGIKSGFSNYSIDYRLLNIENPGEFQGGSNMVTTINFNVGSGFYIYTKKYFLGLAVPNLLTNKYIDSYNNTLANSSQNYFITSGYVIELNDEVILKPTLMSRIVKGAPLSTLYAINLEYNETFYGSLNFDFDNSIGFFSGFRFMENIMVGYSYDTSINNFSNYSGGIHSAFLNYRIADYWKRERCSCSTF